MTALHTLKLGPLSFRTTSDSGPTEALGNAIEVVGAALTSADPTPKPFALTVPVGWAGADQRDDGLRARRQVRSLVNNPQARLQGLRFSWTVDPDFDGWLLVGSADLEPGDASGITHGEWRLNLKDCYVAGRPHTHRPALQASVVDLTLPTNPRDQRRTRYSSDFSSAPKRTWLPLARGARDVVSYGPAAIVADAVQTRDGELPVVEQVVHGQLVSFEQDAADLGGGDVAVFDPRDPAEAAWERVFGPDHPLDGRIPVLDNGICRVRQLSAGSPWLVLDAWDDGWQERLHILLQALETAHVVEWTPERAVVAYHGNASSTGVHHTAYMSLQRGWSGPKFECYSGAPGTATVQVSTAASELVALRRPTASAEEIVSGNPLPAATFVFPGPNWFELDHGAATDAIAPLARDLTVATVADTIGGAPRGSVRLTSASPVVFRTALRRRGTRVGAELGARTLMDVRAAPTLVART